MSCLWTQLYEPKSIYNLDVNRLKISQLQSFLKNIISDRVKPLDYLSTCPILILSGPCGSGKTSMLRVLCQSEQIDIIEWETPCGVSEGLGISFYRFIVNSIFYKPAKMETPKPRIVLIKELPYTLVKYNSPICSEIKYLLTKNHMSGCSLVPIIFITNESKQDRNFLRCILPENRILTTRGNNRCRKNIETIKLNPFTQSAIKKRLYNILKQEGINCTDRETSIVNSITISANGDMSHAINQLQFCISYDTFLNPTTNLNINEVRCKSNRNINNLKYKKYANLYSETNMWSIISDTREHVGNIFSVIGKILYNKRESVSEIYDREFEDYSFKFGEPRKKRSRLKRLDETTNNENLESNSKFLNKNIYLLNKSFLQHDFFLNRIRSSNMKRDLAFDPESIISSTDMDDGTLALLLHENYIHFIGKEDDLALCADIFSFVDSIFSNRNFDSNFLSSVCISRGILLYNTEPLNPCSRQENQNFDNNNIYKKPKRSQMGFINKSYEENTMNTSSRWTPKGSQLKTFFNELKLLKDEISSSCADILKNKSGILFKMSFTLNFSRSLLVELFPYIHIILKFTSGNYPGIINWINESLLNCVYKCNKYEKYVLDNNQDPRGYNPLYNYNTNYNYPIDIDSTSKDVLTDEQLVSILETYDIGLIPTTECLSNSYIKSGFSSIIQNIESEDEIQD
ncbi:uncharacterized protein CMU_034750 [Cryptosporidium muris RN66]|uniref:Rad17 cell cycle checkpoint protein n=1 Tax=Cryptosporidium muris (strain RN66) TaxID=441375 RepID=B6AFU8_CRYMR|nr:uncharacterized protein CMU_034750 [Cryptosporidium muris RN66]EEA07089.1 hypothetical protein, conserved [Cryptosporidium muris RN66]|eukprot:XP_002141438.1 hypothetical protein [Cryptosporidium muris RN66]